MYIFVYNCIFCIWLYMCISLLCIWLYIFNFRKFFNLRVAFQFWYVAIFKKWSIPYDTILFLRGIIFRNSCTIIRNFPLPKIFEVGKQWFPLRCAFTLLCPQRWKRQQFCCFFYVFCLCMHIILQAFLTKSLFYLLEQKTKEIAFEFVGTNLETKLKIKLICEEFFVRKGLKRFAHCFCHKLRLKRF